MSISQELAVALSIGGALVYLLFHFIRHWREEARQVEACASCPVSQAMRAAELAAGSPSTSRPPHPTIRIRE